MIDITANDELISLTTAAKLFPGSRGAARTHPATITRWILTGLRRTDGKIIKLAGARMGYRWFTTIKALNELSGELSSIPIATTDTPQMSSGDIAAANQECARMGA